MKGTATKAKKAKREGKTKNVLYKRGGVWYLNCTVNGTRHRKRVGPEKTKAEAILAEIKKESNKSAYWRDVWRL